MTHFLTRRSAADRTLQTLRLAALVGAACSLFASACGLSDLVPVLDFAQRAPSGHLSRHRDGYDFSADERAQRLLERGWSAPEVRLTDDVSFAWAVGLDASLEFLVLDRQNTWLHFRCWPRMLASGDTQRVTVRVNGAELGTLPLEPSVSVYSLPIPLDVLATGRNTVSFQFAHVDPPDQRDAGGDERALAAAFDYVVLSPNPEASLPRVPTGELRVTERAFEQPAGSDLVFSTVIPENGALEFRVARGAAATNAAVLLRTPDGTERTISADAARGWFSQRQRVDLSAYAGEAVDIVFRVTLAPDDQGVAWEEPRLLGSTGDTNLVTNVLLIVVDTLRADHVGSYGGAAATPHMDALAAFGVRFERAYTHIPVTVPSHSTMFTSLLPNVHGVHSNFQRLNQEYVTMAELLRRSYRDTAAFVSLGVLNENTGLAQGFDEYHAEFGLDWWKPAEDMTDAMLDWSARSTGAPYFLWAHYSDPHEPYARPDPDRPRIRMTHDGNTIGSFPVDTTTVSLPIAIPPGRSSVVLEWEDEQLTGQIRIRNFHARDASISISCDSNCEQVRNRVYRVRFPAHFTVENDSEQPSRTDLLMRADQEMGITDARRRYLEEVEYADQQLGRLLDALREAGQLDDTLTIFTADHGEGLGDHGGVGGMGHVRQLYESQLRVPLIFSWPGHLPEGMTVETPVSLVDLLPTVLDLLNVPDPMNRVGRSLAPLIDAERSMAPRPIVAATFQPGPGEDLQAVVVGDHKLIQAPESGRVELYDLAQDPAENASRVAGNDALVTDLRNILEAAFSATVTYEAGELELSEEELQRLRALGYVR